MGSRLAAMQATLRWRPEWPFVLAIGAAWAFMAAGATGTVRDGHAATNGFVCTIALAPGAKTLALAGLSGWGVMSIAMTLPVTLPWMRYVGLNSLRGRRLWAMLLYGTGFIAVWLAVGVAELGAAALLGQLGPSRAYSTAFALLVAGAWEFSRVKRLALVRCHRTVALPPVGRRADLACIEFGARRGLSCAISCWALMFIVVVVGSTQLALMAGLTALGIAQERTVVGWRLLPVSGVILLAVACVSVIGASR